MARANDIGPVEKRAFVFDDSLKQRTGKKVEVNASKHFDHNESRVVQGHQVLEMGMAGEKGFPARSTARSTWVKSNPVSKPEDKDFRDKRSSAAQDMRRARDEDKNTMLRRMLRAGKKAGLRAKYVLADAWFGTRQILTLSCRRASRRSSR